MSTKALEINSEQLVRDYEAYKVQKTQSFSGPSQANRCSVLGHPCTAYCYYDRTVDPIHRVQISSDLASIFAEGNDQERIFQRDLNEMGYDVKQQQGSLSWPKYNITGHRDFEVTRNGSGSVSSEFKSVHPLLWAQLNTPQDVKNHRAYFIKKWYYQTALYLILKGAKTYWLILKNKSSGKIKVLVFEWNDELAEDGERMIKKAEAVNSLVNIGEVREEDKIADADICNSCEFLTVCNPPLGFGKGATIMDEETAAELNELAEERAKLERAHKAFESYDEELKSRIKALASDGKDTIVFGDWMANVSRQNVKPEKEPRKGFVKTIVKLVKLVIGNEDLEGVQQ